MPAWEVEIAAHTVAGPYVSYEIPEAVVTVGGPDAPYARLQACERAHVRAGVPPWKPYLRQTWPHARVRGMVESAAERAVRKRD